MALGFIDSARNSLSNLGGSGNTMMAKMGSAGAILGKTFVYIVCIGGVVLFLRKMIVYNRKVFIFKRFSSGLRMFERKGRFFRDRDGKYKFYITKSNPLDFKRKSIPITDQEYFISLGRTEAIFLLQVGPDDYKPIKLQEELMEITEESWEPMLDGKGNPVLDQKTKQPLMRKTMPRLNVSVMDMNASNHALQMQKDIVDKHRGKSKLMFYAPMILFVMGMFVILAALWITLGRIETMNNAMTSGYKLMADAIKDFGKQIL